MAARGQAGQAGQGPLRLDWSGATVVIVASGPSARDAPLGIAEGRCRCIAINESWRLAPWADVLYACDARWWIERGGVPEFGGRKAGFEPPPQWPEISAVEVRKTVHDILLDDLGATGSGGNSGFQALNLAVQWGARRVLLVGYDMTVAHGLHWHGAHPAGLNNPQANTIAKWRERLDAVAPALAAHGVEILNCSPASALTAYRKTTIEEALNGNARTCDRGGGDARHPGRGEGAPEGRAQ